MLPKKYHAIIFIFILVMLLLLGLHLLGIGYSGSQAAAKSAALARNSSQPSSSAASALNAALSQNQVYRHPISYDKLTGTTNNQISEVLGAKQAAADYPIDHYQQQQQQQRPQQPQFATNPLAAQDDFFTNIHRGQTPAGFPPPPPPLGHHPALSHRLQVGPPPLAHQIAMTTQPPMSMPLPPLPPPTPPNSSSQRSDQLLQPTSSGANGGSSDSLPSASSLTGAPGARPPGNNTQQQPQQPAQYTPPIFAYNNFEQQQPLGRPAGQFNEPNSFGFAGPSQRLSLSQQQQGMPLGLSQEMSPDEYQARQQQARLRHLSQQQLLAANEVSQQPISQQQQQSPNLLADPQQQQRHKQQMLDRQLLFGNSQPSMSPFDSGLLSLQNQTQKQHGFLAADPATSALYRPGGGFRQPPYAHSGLSGGQMGSAARMAGPTSLGLKSNINTGRLEEPAGGNQQQKLHHQIQMPERQLVKSLNPAPLLASSQQQGQQPQQQQQQSALTSNSPNLSSPSTTTSQMPICAAKQRTPSSNGVELANSTMQPVVLFCNEDSEYPTKEIMRALEAYAAERSIEQLLPQLLIHMDQRATSAGLDPLLPVDGASAAVEGSSNQQRLNQQSMSSSNYEPMCRSASYLAQPRRARNLLGQWKVVVNLPGHKYRGIAVSQMVRVEECLRPNSECNTPSSSSSISTGSLSRSTISAPPSVSLLPKSRCLQHYESQRLVAWSHQQGLHLDIFRVPIACSCHIRR